MEKVRVEGRLGKSRYVLEDEGANMVKLTRHNANGITEIWLARECITRYVTAKVLDYVTAHLEEVLKLVIDP